MSNAVPIPTLRQWFRPSDKRPSESVGAEFEFLVVDRISGREAKFDGERGVERVLDSIRKRGAWDPVYEADRLIALKRADSASVTLEPGCQMELSTPPRASVVEIQADLDAFTREFKSAAQGTDLELLGIGLNPFSLAEEIELVPKERYRIMTEYLRERGRLALDMMRRTMSVHCTFDYRDETDAIEKARAALIATPIVAAIFSHSPIERGKSNGFQSYRTEIWRHTDPDRCGEIPGAFDPAFGFDRYVDLLLELPLIFTVRENRYRRANGVPAARWFSGELTQGEAPRADDLEWVINQSFRDVRLRRYLECRASDFPPARMATAPIALWTGILYNASVREEILKRGSWSKNADFSAVMGDVALQGLRARIGREPVRNLALWLLDLSRAALVARGFGEERLLDPAIDLVQNGQTPADLLLRANLSTPSALIDHLRF